MTHYALIGHPLGHSLSPQIHRALLAAAHLEGDYRLLDIAPEDLANRLPELQMLRGFNVTIPHKQAVLSAMAELDEKAALFGAVNTVAVRDGRFYGYNTDCYGFLRSLSAAGISLAGRVLVLGTGGGALTFDENVRTLRTTGKIVLLDASFDVICQRVGNGANRPLFRDPVQAKALYDARQAKYRAAADYAVDGDASARKTALTIANLFR